MRILSGVLSATIACMAGISVAVAQSTASERVVLSFDSKRLPPELSSENARLQSCKTDSGRRLEVRLGRGPHAGITLAPSEGYWDWNGFKGIAFDVENPSDAPLTLTIRVRSRNEAEKSLTARRSLTISGKSCRAVPFFFANLNAGPYWGMRGIPLYGPLSMVGFPDNASNVYPGQIMSFSVYVEKPAAGTTIYFDDFRLFAAGNPLEILVAHPFIDRFGQYKHAEWPGKIHTEEELKACAAAEKAALSVLPALPERDSYGGWTAGPQLEATGWFRAEQVNGKWWLVTPEGHLFLSMGVNCVHHGDATFIDGRPDWFEWRPESGGPFTEFLYKVGGTHSMADPIQGHGIAANFYGVNLKRKYGEEWMDARRETAYQRLAAWGFNTIGNWSAYDVLIQSPMPFTIAGGSARPRAIEGSQGYWGKMTDVFDPAFGPETEKSIESLTEPFRNNPRVLGYFIDNEMSWSNIPASALASPPDQPARRAFIEDLKTKYGSLEKLNAAWNTDTKDWDSLRLPVSPTTSSKADADAFEYRFGRHYFDTVAGALRKCAPNQLYLGCRFALIYCPENILRSCAEVVDVVSINCYSSEIRPDMYADLGKPVIIGEFHFGATDRGMFHPGLQAAADQADRGRKYTHYVKSVAMNPAFVGCHWFEYIDQPVTGRTYDGESYNIGLVDVTDVPYRELVDAAKDIHGRIYKLRYGKP